MKKGWLNSGSLYPDGSNEGNPELWRSRDLTHAKVFSLVASEDGYEVRGSFKEAGRFCGKEDFDVTRTGLELRIRGKENAEGQSLVRGLDETVTLPADADFGQITAEYVDSTLSIKLPRSAEMHELLKQLSVEEAQALALKHGIASPVTATSKPTAHASSNPASPASSAAKEQVDACSEEFWAHVGQTIGLSVSAADTASAEVGANSATQGGEEVESVGGGGGGEAAALRSAMRDAGYAELAGWARQHDGEEEARLESYAAAIDELEKMGFPPAFLMAFAAPWASVSALASRLAPVYGLSMQFDFTVFNVKLGGAGWSMHRDRPGADTKRAFSEPEGMPRSTTVWLALTDATPATSCIYVLPAPADPHYRCAVDADASAAADDADITLIAAAEHQHIRALPTSRGTALVWSHRLIHWGSAHGGGLPDARKTIAFGMSDIGFEAALLAAPSAVPQFEARLALIALTLIGYHHTEPVARPLIPLILSALARGSSHLSDAALAWGRRFGTSFQRNLVDLHDGLVDLAASFAALAASGAPPPPEAGLPPEGFTPAKAAAAHAMAAREASRQAMEQAVMCGTIAKNVISARGLAAADSFQRVASKPAERALEPTGELEAAATATAKPPAAVVATPALPAVANAVPSKVISEVEPVAPMVVQSTTSKFEEVD